MDKMKIIHIKRIALLFLVSVISLNCEKEEVFNRYDPPIWTLEQGSYSVNMTAVVVLPPNIKPYMASADMLSAFAGESCRGVASIVGDKFYITIKGSAGELSGITFKYYSSRNKYLYQAQNCVQFESDLIYGTEDQPVVLPLQVIK
jgi:hypothetical protein